VPSNVGGTGPEAASIEERAEKVKLHLQGSGDFAATHFMKQGEGEIPGRLAGARGGGSFSTITNREEQASKAPIFRDVAPDVYWATGQIVSLLPACIEAARSVDLTAPPFGTPVSGGPPPSVGSAGVEVPKAPEGMF
jgi:hypothetical protein